MGILKRFLAKKEPRLINLSAGCKFDSQHKCRSAVILYNKSDLESAIGDFSDQMVYDADFFELLDNGKVAVYSEIENKVVLDIKKEVYDNNFERRIRYRLPDGTCFIDFKTMCKTPNFHQ